MEGRSILRLFLFIGISVFFLSCAQTEGKTKIPKNLTPTKLRIILENPKAYDGKKVLLSGIFSGACSEGCEFTYSEGTATITIYPNYELAKMTKQEILFEDGKIKGDRDLGEIS